MPLRAISDNGNIQAFELTPEQWTELKGHYRTLNLRIPCCNAQAVPKTSTLGNFFFAHARKGECTTAPESAEHIYCKNLIAQAAQNAGWVVTTERPGTSKTGEDWIADVFCEKGNAKVALEVQMSAQTIDETKRRQARYQDSGVRSAWLLGPKAAKVERGSRKELPAFALGLVEVGKIPKVERFDVDLKTFVVGMLNRQLQWTRPVIQSTLYIEYCEDMCWSCNQPIKQVYGSLEVPEDAGEFGWDSRLFTEDTISADLEMVTMDVANSALIEAGLNPITKRTRNRGKVSPWVFVNACIHCEALQDNRKLAEKLRQALYGLRRSPVYPFEDLSVEYPIANPIGLMKLDCEVTAHGRWQFTPLSS